MASYKVNKAALAPARELIAARRHALRNDSGERQPSAADQNRFLKTHTWDEYGAWHLGLTEGPADETKARYAFVLGDFRRIHRTGVIAVLFRAAEWPPQGGREGRLPAAPGPRPQGRHRLAQA